MPSYAPKNVDTLLFSFRLLRAVFHYLKNILVQGKRIDVEKALRVAPEFSLALSLKSDQ